MIDETSHLITVGGISVKVLTTVVPVNLSKVNEIVNSNLNNLSLNKFKAFRILGSRRAENEPRPSMRSCAEATHYSSV